VIEVSPIGRRGRMPALRRLERVMASAAQPSGFGLSPRTRGGCPGASCRSNARPAAAAATRGV